jgi:hypothetical protein
MPNLNYFRGSPGGTGVPAGWGQSTNAGAAGGVSKGMDALAQGLSKFFQNKKEQAEEDAYAELLEKLNEVPGKTKEDVSSRKTSGEVMSAAMQDTENLPGYLTNAAAQGHIEEVPFTGPMPIDPASIDPTQTMMPMSQEMLPNPDVEGMLYDPESGEYYPHLTDTMLHGKGTGQFLQSPDGNYIPASSAATEFPGEWTPDQWEAGMQPVPQTIPGQMLPDIPPGVPMDRPEPYYRATEAGMAGQQVPLSFGEQDQARQQLIAEYTRRIGTDRAEKLMGEQFKTHRGEAGNPIAYSYGKSFQLAPKTDPSFTEKDFIDFEVGGVKGVMNRRNGTIKLPTQEGALEEGITALKQMKEMNRASLVALKEAGTTHVYFDPEDKVFKDPALDDSFRFDKHPTIEIGKAIAAQTTEESTSRSRATDLLHNR